MTAWTEWGNGLTSNSFTFTIRDNDPTVVNLALVGAGVLGAGEALTFTVSLGRGLVKGEIIDVPLAISGAGVSAAGYTLSVKSGTGAALSGSGTLTPNLRFSGAGAQAATLELVPGAGSTATRYRIALGPARVPTYGSPAKGFARAGLGTNVGGGAYPSETNNGFSVNVVEPPSKATGLSAVAGNGEVSLSWSDPGNSDISGWQVQQKEGTGSYGSWTAISGSGASTTSHTVSGLSNGTVYTFRIRAVAGTVNGAASAEVTATPLASVVEFSAARYDGSEAGGSGTVTVGLRAAPSFSTSTTVSYRVGGTASSGADFTALAGALSMTGGGGSLAVSILEDRLDEEAETIVLQLDGGSGYTVGGRGSATITIADDDRAGVSLSSGFVSVSEAAGDGNSASYAVVLESEPTADVSITVTSGDPAAATVSPSSLRFSPSTWAVSRKVTVRGVDDSVDQRGNRSVAIVHSVVSDDGKYNGISISEVSATVVDDDGAGVNISEPSLRVREDGSGTASYTVVLNSQPTDTVTVGVTAGAGVRVSVAGGAAGGAATLTFTSSTWNAPQAVTVRGEDDAVDNRNDVRRVGIRHVASSSDAQYRIPDAGTVRVVVEDDSDRAGVSISSSSLTVSEAAGDGNSASYRVVLESEPTHEVSIRVTSGDPAAARVSPSSLRFSRSTWAVSQKVTVTGVDDDVEQNGNRSATIRHRATSTDPKYNGNNISISDVTATVEDDGGGVEDADGGPSQPVEDEGGAIVLTFPPYEGRWFYTEGVAIPSLVLPAATGGRGGVSYALTPALPAGLRLESGGIVRGTPTEVQQARSYTWRATDADGNEAALVFSITVAEDPRRRQGRGEAKRLLAALGREALAVSLDTIGARLGAVSGGGLTLAGQPVWLEGGAATAVGAGGAAWRPGADGELLSTSAFSLPLAAGERGSNGGAEGERPLWAVWGRGDLAGFAGAGAMAYDGWLRSGFLGLDRRAGAWVGGLALSHEQGQADYSGVGDGRLETSLTALYPYGRWRLEEGLEVQGVVGAGWGEARRQPEGGAEERGRLSMQMAALGVSQALPPVAGLALSLRADGAVTAMETDSGPSAVHGLRANSWRLRAGLEASGRFQLDGAGWLEPFLEGAVRQDGGDGLVGRWGTASGAGPPA